MIKIGTLKFSKHDGRGRVTADIDCDGFVAPLWFEVEEQYAEYLCYERSDAYVLGLLHYAMKFGHDIVCETPMTGRLYEQLTGQFLPPFYKVNGFGRDGGIGQNRKGFCTKITCEIAPEIDHHGPQAVATGISCGVDSLHVFATHSDITHACIWNGHGIDPHETVESRNAAWGNLIERAKNFSAEVGVDLIVGNTNFDRGCLKQLQWDGMTTQGNLFCIFSLQKLWQNYYVASDCAIDNFHMRQSLNEDPAHYEYFLFPLVSLKNMTIRMDGADCRRIEKIRALIGYAPSYKFLNTCWGIHEGHKNCSCFCPKCMRTMLALYCLGALDMYSSVYDVEYFKRHVSQYIAEYYRGCLHNDFFATEITPYLKNVHVGIGTKIAAWTIVLKKIFRKLIFGSPKSFQPS